MFAAAASVARAFGGRGRRHFSSGSSPFKATARDALERLGVVVRFGAAAYVVQVYVANSTMSIGPSMLPTLNVRGDVLLTEYITPRLGRLKAGDVVVAVKPTDPAVSVLKRIRGMPGECVWVHPRAELRPIQIVVPDDHVWLEGDNAAQSTDSREYGPVPLPLVKGRVVLRFWPPGQARMFHAAVIDHTAATRARLDGPHTNPAPPVATGALLDAECQSVPPTAISAAEAPSVTTTSQTEPEPRDKDSNGL